MAVYQLKYLSLTYCYRGQAPSHMMRYSQLTHCQL
jgi:hypothetical protein